MSPSREDHEAGSSTVWVLAALLAICGVGALWMAGAQAGFSRQRAEVAADLSAVAAAQALDTGVGSPCAAAASVAGRNGARVTSCAVSGESVIVTVEVASPTRAVADARAGPVEPAPSGTVPQ